MKRDRPSAPPSWAVKLFRWYCNDHLSEAVLGDLIEIHQRRSAKYGSRRADLLFVMNVLSFIQPFALRKKSNQPYNQVIMFRSYLTIAWRSMMKQKMYAAIKVGGFALGLATCMVIALYIRHELDYDKHYALGDRTYRMYNENLANGDRWNAFPALMAARVREDFPEVEKVGRLIPFNWYRAGNNLTRRLDRAENTYEEGFAYADPDMLDLLDIRMVEGDRFHALSQPNSIVISKSKADKYFRGEQALGQSLVLNDDAAHPYVIGGVMEDMPLNMHINFQFFVTLSGVEFWEGEQTSWNGWNYCPYVRLKPGADPVALEQKMISIVTDHFYPDLVKYGNVRAETVKENHRFRLQLLSDIYLHSDGMNDSSAHGNLQYIWLFGVTACIILLLACINFINLSTARSANRAKEVGLRKVVGSQRGLLVRQFLTESFLYSIISFVIAVALLWTALPWFNILAGKDLIIPWNAWWLLPSLLGSALFVGFIAGIYPSFYLSGFNPVDMLRGSLSRGSKSSSMRSAMVVFQFTASIVLMIGTFVIYRQVQFMLSTRVGFNKEHVILIHGANTLGDRTLTLKDELLRLPGIENVTVSNYLPVGGTKRDQNAFFKEGMKKEDKEVGAQRWIVDDDYIATMGMKLVEGRNFQRDLASDSAAIILNQAMVKALGLKDPVVGQRVENWRVWTVIGVVEDFHYESMRGPIQPLSMVLGDRGAIASVRVNTSDLQKVLTAITGAWNELMPNQPIRYTFLDESFARMYDDVRRTGRIFFTFSILAIVVACLGLFALSAYMVEQRTKEVSIRLVLGASVSAIFRMLTTDFLRLVAVSFLVAAPLGWYLMTTWLKDFAYKMAIGWEVFLLAGILSVVIALLTVAYQSLRAALTQPVNALRSE
jgi:putative ABC transport system permease protein